MVQLAAIIKEPRECRSCKRIIRKTGYLEIEGAVVIVATVNPEPTGATVFVHRGIFCNLHCFSDYLKKMYKEGPKGKVTA